MIVLWSVVVEVFAIGRVPLTEVPLYIYITCTSCNSQGKHTIGSSLGVDSEYVFNH